MTMFSNATLVNEMMLFVGIVDERIATLRAHAEPRVASAVGALDGALMSEALTEGACVDLARQIERHAERVGSNHRDLPAETISEFAYLMAAWVDETLFRTFRERLPRSFAGAVEHRLFGTMDAGEQVFTRIDRALARRSYGDLCLSGAYLLALALGFRGQYAEYTGHEALANYQRELSAFALVARGSDPASLLVGEAPGDRVNARPPFWSRPFIIWALVAVVWAMAAILMEVRWRQAARPVLEALEFLEGPAAGSTPSRSSGERP